MSTTLAPRKPSVPTVTSTSSRLTKPTASSANRTSRNTENNGATHNKQVANAATTSALDVSKADKPKPVKKPIAAPKLTTTITTSVLTPSPPAVVNTSSLRAVTLSASKTVITEIAPTVSTSATTARVNELQETIDNLKRELMVTKLAAHAASVDAKRYEEKLREVGIDPITLRLIAPVDITDDTPQQQFVRTQTRSRYVSESVRQRTLSALKSPLTVPPPAATPFNTPRQFAGSVPGSTQRRHHTSLVMTPGAIPPMSEESSDDLDDGILRVPLGSFLIGTESLSNERYSIGSNISMMDRSFTDAEIMAQAY